MSCPSRYSDEYIAARLDYTLLSPTATKEDIEAGAAFVNKHGLASLCVASGWVGLASSLCDRVCSVIGFPHGNMCSHAKFSEAWHSMDFCACELDVVINYGKFLNGDTDVIYRDLDDICSHAHERGVKVKAILESCYYTPKQLKQACKLCVMTGVDWVKTSTGFASYGATPQDVEIMLEAVNGSGVGVKASGGIRTYHEVAHYLDMGCSRIGASCYHNLCHGS